VRKPKICMFHFFGGDHKSYFSVFQKRFAINQELKKRIKDIFLILIRELLEEGNNMSGLLYPAYQKFYSAMRNLERFKKESNFFDNISAIDNFFNEYRNITFVMEASLSHTEFLETYKKHVKDLEHWFVEKRNETTKQKPFQLVKEIDITIYLPFGGFNVYKKKFSVENDEPIEAIFSEIKQEFKKIDNYEVWFSVAFSFHEADSDINLLAKLFQGIATMKSFMEIMENAIGEKCSLCEQLKQKINNMYMTDVPLDFLLINDYTYYPDKDYFERAELVSFILISNNKKRANSLPLSTITQSRYINYDGTAFKNFTLMNAMFTAMYPGKDILPSIMVIYDDETYDLDTFATNMKTTMYRKIMEVANLIKEQNITEVCYTSLYSVISTECNLSRTSRERKNQAISDILVCASIDKQLNEKEYVFEGKYMKDIKYVAYVMKNGLKKQLGASATNLFPIKQAFENKRNSDKE